MKLDNDPSSRLPSPPRKSYNPFDSDDDSPRTMTADSFAKGNVGFEVKEYEATPDSLADYVQNADFSWEEAILGHPKVDNHAFDATLNGHGSLFEKETKLYTDKTIMECELPEFIVCYKENAYQSVKDIGIDEGVPFPDKIWVKGREDTDLPTFMDLNGGGPDSDAGRVPIHEGFLSKAADQPCAEDSGMVQSSNPEASDGQYSSHQFETDYAEKSKVMKHDAAENKTVPDLSAKDVETKSKGLVSIIADTSKSPENTLEMDASERRDSDLMHNHQTSHNVVEKGGGTHYSADEGSESNDSPSVQVLDPKDVILRPKVSDEGEEKVSPFQSASEEALSLESPDLPTVDGSANSSKNEALPYDSKIESGSITFDFNSSNPLPSPGMAQEKKIEHVAECEKAPQTQTMTRDGEGGAAAGPASITMLDERDNSETSFSTNVGPASITFLGPIAYSGNTSLRSESSAGSTRSFAFPVLQTEWNSSPVRMAKDDQRHFRRHRGIEWVRSLICCRF